MDPKTLVVSLIIPFIFLGVHVPFCYAKLGLMWLKIRLDRFVCCLHAREVLSAPYCLKPSVSHIKSFFYRFASSLIV
jgi:hypothetical protein